MIQLGGLRPWYGDDGELIATPFRVKPELVYPSIKEMFDKIFDDLYKIPETERYNLFYTLAHHLKGERSKTSWQCQNVIPFDLDGIDLDLITHYPQVVADAAGFDLDKCAIIHTGNGIHILVQVPRISDKNYIVNAKLGYKQVIKRIQDACDEGGLPVKVDSTAWDYGRIFRVPFTENRKIQKDGSVKTKQCELIQNNLEAQDFELPFIEPAKNAFSLPKGSFPRPDQSYIMKSCDFFKFLITEPDEVHEPHAYAMLSITGHFDDDGATSSALWEKFSSPSINSKDLNEFSEQALKASGPRTCQGIDDVYGKCKLCPNFGKVTSPIMLKGAEYIGTSHCGFTLRAKNGSLVRQYGDLLRAYDNDYYHKSVGAIKKIYGYTGTHYKVIDQIEIRNFAYEKLEPISKSQERAEFLGLVTDSNYIGEEFLSGSNNKGFVNFKNGTLDIKTGELLPHDKDKHFLYCLPYDYDPTATCSAFDSFLHDITLGREELSNILLEYLGYVISGSNYKYQKALILSGSGKNGKSTFINLLNALVGEGNCSSISIKMLEANVFASSGLHGKLVNFSEEEPPSTFSESNGVFKNITGDGIVNAQYKFGNAFEFRNRAKLIISYNEMPYMKDTSIGMIRRLLICPFDYDLEANPHKVNPDINEHLRAELSGIFNKALEGYRRLEEQKGFTKSKIVEKAVDEVHRYSDIVKAFLDDSMQKTDDESDMVSFNLVEQEFQKYFEDQNCNGKKLSKKALSARLKKYGYASARIKKSNKQFVGFKCAVLIDANGYKISENRF